MAWHWWRRGWAEQPGHLPILPLQLCGWECIGTSSPALGTARESPGWAGSAAGTQETKPREQSQGQEGAARWDRAFILGVSPWASSCCSGSSQHKSSLKENPPEISNIPRYIAFTTKIAACTAQASPELSNKIWNPVPLAWDAQIFCNSYRRSWLTAGAASWYCLLCTQNHTKQKQFGDFSFTK